MVLASYGITAAVMFWSGSTISDETKALLLGQIVIFGFVTVLGFLFGSNISEPDSRHEGVVSFSQCSSLFQPRANLAVQERPELNLLVVV